MNPIVNALKNLSTTTVNIIVALIFFIVTAKITNPTFFGKIAIIQLLEVISVSFFLILNTSIVNREVSYMHAKNEIDKTFISTVLLTPFIISPVFLILLVFPLYVKLTIPYMVLYIFGAYISSILTGMNKFTESAILGSSFLIIRWIVSIIAVLLKNIYLFIGIWTLGALVTNSIGFIIIYKALNGLPMKFDPAIFKSIFRVGLPLYLSSGAGFLSSQGDRVTTSYLLGSYYLGLYQFAALVASVPSMIISSLSGVLLPSSSYYKALGKDEVLISQLSFKVVSLLTLIIVAISVPFAEILIPKLFPDYTDSIKPMIILLLASTLPAPIGILTTFLVSFNKSLRPFLILTGVNAFTTLFTSFLLIPRIGIMGGAYSQLAVTIISSSFTLFYVLREKVFHPTRKEGIILSLIPLTFLFELLVDPTYMDIVYVILIIMVFKLLRVFENKEKEIILNFTPSMLRRIVRIFL